MQVIENTMNSHQNGRLRSRLTLALLASGLASLLLCGCALVDSGQQLSSQDTEAAVIGGTTPPAPTRAMPGTATPAQDEDELAAAAPHQDLWVRLREGFGLPHQNNPRIAPHLAWYRNNPAYLDRVFDRADPFLHHILEQLEARSMPAEIALLPVVESAFDPFAYSHGRAAGLWQFIPGTATRFGLKQDWWYDGRRDVIASTEAALDYLQYLHRFFDGDWMLALAAYNSGEGTVRNAVRRNRAAGKPVDFWHLDLPRETRHYVPKLLALGLVVDDPEQHGLALPPIANEARIALVDTGGQLDLAIAAQLAELPLDDLYKLNPGFNRWATDPEGPHRLVLPVDRAGAFAAALAELPPERRLNWLRHEIRPGETLSEIAKRHQTTVAVLRETNQLTGHQIRAGHHLLVPVAASATSEYRLSSGQRLAQTQNRDRGGVRKTHQVQRGDTFWDLSRRYDVPLRSLAQWNNMAPGDTLRPGQKLVIWDRNANRQTLRTIRYQVRRGDSLARISSRFKVSIHDLLSWNGIRRDQYLQPGQTLKLYVDVTSQTRS
jgi:membrane-bound lytic murein transglycosylase D